MTPSLGILDFALDQGDQVAEADVALVIERAAQIVREFTVQSAKPTLDAILAAAEEPDAASAVHQAQALADETARQSELLEAELARFMALSADS